MFRWVWHEQRRAQCTEPGYLWYQTSLSFTGSQPVADHWIPGRLPDRVWHRPGSPLRELRGTRSGTADRSDHHVLLVATGHSRVAHPWCPQRHRTPGIALWHDLVHRQRGHVLRRLLLVLLQLPPVSRDSGGRADGLAADQCPHVRSVPPAVSQHHDPAAVRDDRNLGAPQPAGRRPQGLGPRPRHHHPARPGLHDMPGDRVLQRTIQVQRRWRLFVGVLPCHRLPRLPRDRRDMLPDRVLVPREGRPIHSGAPFWLRGGCLVLAFCRCGVAVSFHLHLLVWRGADRCGVAGRASTPSILYRGRLGHRCARGADGRNGVLSGVFLPAVAAVACHPWTVIMTPNTVLAAAIRRHRTEISL